MLLPLDDEVLLFRPTDRGAVSGDVERQLAATPGAFRDPHQHGTWILPSHPQFAAELERARRDHPERFPSDARVEIAEHDVVVYPDSAGRARQFVTWLLAHGAYELEVRGRVVGPVSTPAEIYGDAPWLDPDAAIDPTEPPPSSGAIFVLERDRPELAEQLAIHDSGILSYEQIRPTDDPVKTFRRMLPDVQHRWAALVQQLPLDADVPGPDGVYLDAVFLHLETPRDSIGTPKVDAARPNAAYREILGLIDAWATALRADRMAMPSGLTEFSR